MATAALRLDLGHNGDLSLRPKSKQSGDHLKFTVAPQPAIPKVCVRHAYSLERSVIDH